MNSEDGTDVSAISSSLAFDVTRFALLKNRVQKLYDDCKRLEDSVQNNWTAEGPFNFSDILSGKEQVLKNLCKQVDSKRPQKSLFLCRDANVEAKETISKEEELINSAMKFLSKILTEEEEAMAKLENQLLQVKTLKVNDYAEEQQIRLRRLSQKTQKLNVVFKEYKTVMHELITDLFAEEAENIQEVCADALAAYNSPQEYIDVTEGNYSMSAVVALVNAKLLTADPHNSNKFKFDFE